ncbi:MAG: TIGR02757 family protein [Candidatus Deferrimicrobiaceae bacterium]
MSSDPVRFPRRFADRADAEVAAFVAASFAFGNVGQILAFLERMFRTLGPSPHATLTARRPVSKSRVSGLSHRFISPRGVHRFLLCVRKVLLEHGSLEGLYRQEMEREGGGARAWLAGFLACFREAWGDRIPRERDFLFPDPRKGSACKRHNLFLRWVVRGGDGVDLGIWTVLGPRQLIVPVDTHMARLGKWLGLTSRHTVDGKMAEEITDAFRAVCPEDPVRFDFALTRIGILKACTVATRGTCGLCPLGPACSGGGT